ncbi:MAG: phosphatidylserine decarboxylase [Candidatus Thermoplasmatota archaeon]
MIAKGSFQLILPPFLSAILCLSLFLYTNIFIILLLSLILFLFTAFFTIFFRDPERKIGEGIVAPADGKIIELEKTEKITKISIFMSLWDVHVNRIPLDCKVIKIVRKYGKFLPAYKKVSSYENERLELELETEIGAIKLTQVVGVFARRILCYTKENEYLKKGQRFGMIRFGSRVELYLPTERTELKVKLGDRVLAGESTLAMVKARLSI